MMIVKCDRCGELIHKTEKCLFCGNTDGFTAVYSNAKVHENVAEEYKKLPGLVEQGNFKGALALSDVILTWMPFCSDVFWLRLLAANQCSTDGDLIRKGVSCEDSADYYNALRFACDAEKKVYQGVRAKTEALQKVLLRHITEHEYEEKAKTPILALQTEFPREVDSRKQNMMQLWDELKQNEVQMLRIEKDCQLLINEHTKTLKSVKQDAATIRNAASEVVECSLEDLHNFQSNFGKLLHLSDQAKHEIDTMRVQHPWVKNFDSLVKHRDELAARIGEELKALKACENKAKKTVDMIDAIEQQHAEHRELVDQWVFSDVAQLIGDSRLAVAYAEAGIR